MGEKHRPSLKDVQSAAIRVAGGKGHDIAGGAPWRLEKGLVYVTTCVKCGLELVVEQGRGGVWGYGGAAVTQNCLESRENRL